MSSTLEEDYCQEYYQAGDNQCPNLYSSSTKVFSSSNIVKSIVITLVTSLISLRLHWADLHMHTTFTQQWNYSLNSIWNSHFNLMKKLFPCASVFDFHWIMIELVWWVHTQEKMRCICRRDCIVCLSKKCSWHWQGRTCLSICTTNSPDTLSFIFPFHSEILQLKIQYHIDKREEGVKIAEKDFHLSLKLWERFGDILEHIEWKLKATRAWKLKSQIISLLPTKTNPPHFLLPLPVSWWII